MSIDPKKGGKCWSCSHCEDIATQTDNENGAYYRKCTKSGHEYVDTCSFSCPDYVWDGKDPDFAPSASSSSSSSSATSSSSAPATKSAGKAVGKLIGALITTAIFAFLGYLLLGYSEYLLASTITENVPPLPIISDPYTLEMVIILAPLVMAIVWSIIRRRKIWIGALLTLIACVAVNGMIGEDTTPSHIPLFFAMLIIPYILCLVAALKGKKVASASSSGSSSSSYSGSSSTASAPTQRTYKDYQCYQCSHYWVDADYNGICNRSNSLVDRYKTACSSFSKK